jgi:hypothetical protein
VVVIGGFVYRGGAVPALAGRYVFADDFNPNMGSGRLFHGAEGEDIVEFALADGDLGLFVLGFGQDASGELYVMANETGVPFEDTGVVLRIESVCGADCDADGRLTINDFVCFQEQWQAQSAYADVDGNGAFNILDFVFYQVLFQAGCP